MEFFRLCRISKNRNNNINDVLSYGPRLNVFSVTFCVLGQQQAATSQRSKTSLQHFLLLILDHFFFAFAKLLCLCFGLGMLPWSEFSCMPNWIKWVQWKLLRSNSNNDAPAVILLARSYYVQRQWLCRIFGSNESIHAEWTSAARRRHRRWLLWKHKIPFAGCEYFGEEWKLFQCSEIVGGTQILAQFQLAATQSAWCSGGCARCSSMSVSFWLSMGRIKLPILPLHYIFNFIFFAVIHNTKYVAELNHKHSEMRKFHDDNSKQTL